MNKKGQDGIVIVLIAIIILAIIVGGILWLVSLGLSSGSSSDIAYGVEKNTFWYKLYLKDDHTTVYCIDEKDTNFISIAQSAANTKARVKVDYQEYIFRGSLCNGNDKYNAVVVTNIERSE